MPDVVLEFPAAVLSGHSKGGWRAKAALTKRLRADAKYATLVAGWKAPATGDIPLLISFFPADRRGDRTNFASRIKPQIDGIFDALGANDRRCLPRYVFAEPCSNPRVVYSLEDVCPAPAQIVPPPSPIATAPGDADPA